MRSPEYSMAINTSDTSLWSHDNVSDILFSEQIIPLCVLGIQSYDSAILLRLVMLGYAECGM